MVAGSSQNRWGSGMLQPVEEQEVEGGDGADRHERPCCARTRRRGTAARRRRAAATGSRSRSPASATPSADEGEQRRPPEQAERVNFSLSVELAADDQQHDRQHHDQRARSRRATGPGRDAAASRGRSRRRGPRRRCRRRGRRARRPPGTPGRPAGGRSSSRVVGHLGLELGQDVRPWPLGGALVAHRRSSSVRVGRGSAGSAARQVDAVLLDEGGVALLVALRAARRSRRRRSPSG